VIDEYTFFLVQSTENTQAGSLRFTAGARRDACERLPKVKGGRDVLY
jgi:hypothetical protein